MTAEREELIARLQAAVDSTLAEYDRLKLDLAAAALRAEHPTSIAEKWAAAQMAYDQRNPGAVLADRLLALALDRYQVALRAFTDVAVRGLRPDADAS